MAYLVELKIECDVMGCCSRAMVELRDWRNEARGRFCRKHGRRRLKEREQWEKKNPDLKWVIGV